MAHFPKPQAGSWTENWPELGTAPVDYTDSIDPEQWKLEQQAIFRKTWLHVGRVERLPKAGSYFTREMPSVGPGTSIIVNKDKEGVVRAFYNLCRHRGARLCTEEAGEVKRAFQCPYHAWTYDLDGKLVAAPNLTKMPDIDRVEIRHDLSNAYSRNVPKSLGFTLIGRDGSHIH